MDSTGILINKQLIRNALMVLLILSIYLEKVYLKDGPTKEKKEFYLVDCLRPNFYSNFYQNLEVHQK